MTIAKLTGAAIRMAGEDRVRYALVSFAALGLDTLITLNLTWSGILPALSAGAGYMIGLALHWVLSSRFVFAAELAAEGPARARQTTLFFMSGFGGLAVTVAAYSCAIALGLSAILGKAISVGLSFCLVYLIRRHVIFPQRA